MSPKATASGGKLRGLAALLGLLAVVGGVPWLLLAIGADPVPDRWPTPTRVWESITGPDDGSVLLAVFRYAAWLAWLFIVASLVLEIGARLLGTEAPRLPGLSLPQGIARQLVGAAALLFITAPAVASWAGAASASSHDATTGGVAAATSISEGTTALVDDTDAASGTTEEATAAAPQTVTHEVVHGETLWSIAEQHLGDGTKYTEILDLNRDSVPSSHWITPGQTLQLPATDGPEVTTTHTVERGETLWEIAEEELGDGERYPELFAATDDLEQPDGRHLTDPDLILPGWEVQVPDDSATAERPSDEPDSAATSMTQAATDMTKGAADVAGAGRAVVGTDAVIRDAADPQPTVGEDDPAADWSRTALGIGGITAAGLIGLLELARRRRAAHLGRPVPPDDTGLERELRLVADEFCATTIDLALRHITVAAAEAGRALPGVRTVRVTRTQLDVQLADPMRLPAPWTSTADPRLWTLALDRAATLDAPTLAREAAPFPTLVPVGQDETGAHVLVNLADARTFAVVGENLHTRSTIAAMALALASAPWAGATTVTVVGGHPDLERVIDSDRVRFVPDMAAYSLSVQVQIDPAAREVILVSGDLDTADRRRLDQAVASSPRVALAHAAASAPDGADSLSIGRDPQVAVLSPAYLQLTPQRLTDEDAEQLADLFALAAASTGYWAPAEGEPTLARVGAAAAAMGAPGVVIDPGITLPDDASATVGRSDAAEDAPTGPGVRWNTPVSTPRQETPFVPGEDVPTARRSTLGATARAANTPGWLSNQITPTPGTPLPPVVAFPERVRELAAPTREPVLRLLGPVDIDNVGEVAPAHRMRLTELAAYLRTHPEAGGNEVDDAMWPNRAQHDHTAVRTRSLAGLADWLGGEDRVEALTCDWDLWQQLVPGDPSDVGTERLEQALGLVRGRPFSGVHPRHYVWAQDLRTRMIFAITTTATELARRQLMAGRWSAAVSATVVGLTVEPGVEALWRMQVLATHEQGDREAHETAVAGLVDRSTLHGEPLEAASRDLLDHLSELGTAEASTTTRHAV